MATAYLLKNKVAQTVTTGCTCNKHESKDACTKPDVQGSRAANVRVCLIHIVVVVDPHLHACLEVSFHTLK